MDPATSGSTPVPIPHFPAPTERSSKSPPPASADPTCISTRPIFRCPTRSPLGHEAVGTVVEVGPEVRTVKVGDQVMVSSVTGCGSCAGCATRDPVMCYSGFQIFGGGVLGGAQADLLAVPAADFQLLKIPEGISTEQALLLTDNLATGWAAAQRADIPYGGTVAVIGLGAVGLCALRSAIFQGAATVFAVDMVEGRLDRAAQMGGYASQSAGTRGDPGRHRRTRRRRGDRCRRHGRLADRRDQRGTARRHSLGCRCAQYESVPAQRLGLPDSQHELRITTAPVQRTWPELIPLLQSGRLDVDGIFTTSLPLDEAAKGYATAESRSGDDVKILLKP